ncbi:MAG TPA: maltose alpha-D-glucosyltransferase, partial [Chthoniobacterales bacterium]|nr:maltose alpha-D-glucosyltransferase [Chthoniobacterales bacterium]
MSDPLWFKDAIIYELHVKTFHDSNADGIGDFRGLIEKLDYLQDLGISAIWLLPFYPSPLKDDGYDIANYLDVNPNYGTLDDFRALLDAAHERGLRVITELVINHTSDQNPWFQKSRRAPSGSPERELYVWSDTLEKYKDARIIFKDFETSNWSWDPVAKAYYWHRFYAHQPDLNFDNPAVHELVERVCDFWLNLGVDGLRLDAIPYLYEREGTNCENLPETHVYLKKLRAHIDAHFTDRMLLAEANQWPEDAVAYFGNGDESHMNFHFPLMPRMFMALQMEDRFPIIDILEQTPPIPDNCQWAMFLRNHDELTLEMVTDEERDYMWRVYANDPTARINLGIRRRLAPLLANSRRKIELLNILLFSMPGTPVLYYGDEIGMGDNFYLGDRNGCRTPMQWSADRNAGFSKANPQQLYLPITIDPEYHYEAINVENQQKNLSSLLWWMRRVIAMRKNYRAFSRGSLEFLFPENSKVLAFLRRTEDETILVVVNLSRFAQPAELDLARFSGCVPMEVFSRNRFPAIRKSHYPLTLGPHAHYWFVLQSPSAGSRHRKRVRTPTIAAAPALS